MKKDRKDEYVPYGIAAERANYEYSMIQKLAKRGRVRTQKFYTRTLVNLQDVLDYKHRMQALGAAKHNLRYPRLQEPTDAAPAE